MKILITGNMGYIGPCLTERLRSTRPGVKLCGLDMGYFAHCLTNADILPECRVDVQHCADVRKAPYDIFKDVDAIVHLAAISNDPMGNAYETVTEEINYKATLDLARKAKSAGVRSFVFASSCSMYGYAEGGPRVETSELNPLTAYAKSKVASEQGLQSLADEQFTVTSLRFGTACGMSERLRLDLVLNDFVASAVASKKITILSDGTPWRPLIAIRDMARAIDWAIDRSGTNGGNFVAVNVGTNNWNYQVKDLAMAVHAVIPGTEISVNKDAQPDKRSYRVDFDLYKKLAPEHQPVSTLTDVIDELRMGLEAMRFQNSDFRNSSFMRLKVLKSLQDKKLLSNQLEWTFPKKVRVVSQ